MNEQTLAAIRTLLNNNRGNQAVAGAANDLFFNSLSASLQRDSDASYARTMMPLSLEYQRGQQGIATEADMRRIAAEGGIMRDLTEQEGRIRTDLANINSADVRYSADRQVDATQIGADAQRYGYDQQLAGTRYSADQNLAGIRVGANAQVRSTQIGANAQVRSTQIGANAQVRSSQIGANAQVRSTQIGADAQRYGYDQQLAGVLDTNRSQLEGTKYTADANVKSTQIGADAQRYGADRQVDSTRIGADAQVRSTQIGADAQRYGDDTRLVGVLATNRSQEDQRRIQGDQDRRTLTQGTDEALRLRADARGAIASRGKRFFG
jgi:hypothetical protein